MISSLRSRVEKGTSGAVSLLGTSASLLGATVIGSLATWLSQDTAWPVLLAVSAAGLTGSLIDSLLGATVQAIYFCPSDQKETERYPLHTCGSATIRIRGWAWLNDDLVNVACSVTGRAGSGRASRCAKRGLDLSSTLHFATPRSLPSACSASGLRDR